MIYLVILKSLKEDGRIILDRCVSLGNAEQSRKVWRRALGGKNWKIDRRPGLDTLDHLAITVEQEMK